MAPVISPPGRLNHRNSAPPKLPIASVSITRSALARLGMAAANDEGMRLTPPYGKSDKGRQMRQRDAAMRALGALNCHTRHRVDATRRPAAMMTAVWAGR